MKSKLSGLLKKYVNIFLKEYEIYLSKEQLEILKSINYNQVIKTNDFTIPVGIINYNSIYISDNILNIPKKMDNASFFNNKNYTNYLKQLNNFGCNTYEYYAYQLMFLVFKLVINNDSGVINGFINYEINYLRNKYHFQSVNLYKREEVISKRIISLIGRNNVLKIMFMDMPTSFKYLNDNWGYRYADFYYRITNMVDKEFKKIKPDNYTNKNGLINYAHDYDNLLYGDAYNYLLEFSISNNNS